MTSSGCHSVKVLRTIVGYPLLAMVVDLRCHPANDSRGAVHAMLLSHYSEMLPEILTMEKSLVF